MEFESAEAILANPHLLVKIFEQSSRLGLPLGIEAKRLAREFSEHLIDNRFRGHKAVVHSLNRIITAPPRTFNVLNEMFITGVMVSLVPEVKRIINRVQYNDYHVYPVDKHSLKAVQIMKSFNAPEVPPEKELFKEVFKEVERTDLLPWATLFHDIGKGVEGGQHEKKGAELVKKIFCRMNFPQEDIDTISFLVREHLLLVHTATRRDINDENVVIQCARKILSVQNLMMLYLLTVADSMATGPKAWNDWADVLYREIFFKIKRILEKGELATPEGCTTGNSKKERSTAKNSSSCPVGSRIPL